MDFLSPLYNQLANEQEKVVETIYTYGLVYGDFN
jgi:hypothetical protein